MKSNIPDRFKRTFRNEACDVGRLLLTEHFGLVRADSGDDE